MTSILARRGNEDRDKHKREDPVKIQGKGGHLQTKERASENHFCKALIIASKTGRQ
jgi:hypothetical protein